MPGRKTERLGVTPVISDVLLTVVVVIAMSVLLAWATSYVYFNPWKARVQERFIIEDAWFNTTAGGEDVLGIYIYNYGKVDIRIDAVYISPGLKGPVSSDNYVEGWHLGLRPGGAGRIIVKFDWESGRAYHIKVVTGRGTAAEVLAVAP